MTGRADEAGLSLIEVMVAILILSIAIVGAFRMLDMGVTNASEERTRVLAELVALNRAAELRLGGTDLPQDVELGGRRWRIESDELETAGGFVEATLTARPAEGSAGARIVVWLDPEAAP